jgi:hypothetical protein
MKNALEREMQLFPQGEEYGEKYLAEGARCSRKQESAELGVEAIAILNIG